MTYELAAYYKGIRRIIPLTLLGLDRLGQAKNRVAARLLDPLFEEGRPLANFNNRLTEGDYGRLEVLLGKSTVDPVKKTVDRVRADILPGMAIKLGGFVFLLTAFQEANADPLLSALGLCHSLGRKKRKFCPI